MTILPFFQFGEYPLACPVAAMLQGISIFVSTLSITAIALDRRQGLNANE